MFFNFKGIAFSSPESCKTYNDLVRLYVHEAYRTYSDKLTNEDDIHLFERIIKDLTKKNFEVLDINDHSVFQIDNYYFF
jgi:hypothetical protein